MKNNTTQHTGTKISRNTDDGKQPTCGNTFGRRNVLAFVEKSCIVSGVCNGWHFVFNEEVGVRMWSVCGFRAALCLGGSIMRHRTSIC